MFYYGGPVIPNPKVYVVWWGSPSNLNPAVTAASGGIADFFAGVTNSNYMDWLNEYNTTINANAGSRSGLAGTNQRIGRGDYVSTLQLNNVATSGTVTDAQIQQTLDQAFSANTLPQPDENTIYAIYFPRAVTITLGTSTSCTSFGAYHENTVETVRHNAYYLVMPDCGDTFSGTTSVSSHELIEATTDAQPTPGSSPDYPQAWNNTAGSEVGDLCQSSSGTVVTAFGNFNVQGIWDERSQGCKTFTTDAQDFNVALSPNTATLSTGVAHTFAIQTATTAGAAESLTLTVTAPSGITASISPATITSGQSATLTVTASSAQAAAQVVVRADGLHTHTAAALVTATGAAGNDFSINASPSTLTLATGGSGTSAIGTAVTSGSAGTINLTATVSPAGPAVSLSPASVTAGGSSTLTVGAGATAGSYTVTVTGTEGSATHAAAITLTVTGAGGSGLANGGFESGLTGWTATGQTSAVATSHSGSSAAQIGSTSPTTDSSLSQTFTAPAGATQLSFWYQVHCPDSITYDWASATLKDNTTASTATMLANTCSNTGSWVQATAAVTAAHSYTLTLANHDDNYAGDPTYTWFDDVAFNSAPPPSDFSIAVAPSSLTVAQGASGTASVTTSITAGAAENVSFSATGLPAGVTATFSPGSASSGSGSTLSLAATGSATIGSSTVTITGSAASGAHSTSLSLTITAVSTGGGIANGGFETGSLSGWTPSGTTAAVNSGAHSGTWAARLGSTSPTNGDSSLAQTFTVPAGKATLSFWYKTVCPDSVTYDWSTATLRDNAASTTATVLAKTCTNSSVWTQTSAAVTAGRSYTLTLTSHDDNYAGDATYTLYDDVVLQ